MRGHETRRPADIEDTVILAQGEFFDAAIIGVSKDSAASHDRFKANYECATLLIDKHGMVRDIRRKVKDTGQLEAVLEASSDF